MTVKELHREAMRFNDLAIIASKKNSTLASEYFNKAFDFEQKAFFKYCSISNEEPTRSVLARSSANLALLANLPHEAFELAKLGLKGNPDKKLKEELNDILKNANIKHIEKKVDFRDIIKDPENKKIVLKTRDSLHSVNLKSILYFQAEGNYTIVYISNKDPIMSSRSISNFEQFLPKEFARLNSAIIINGTHLKKFQKHEGQLIITLSNDVEIEIPSENYLESTKNILDKLKNK